MNIDKTEANERLAALEAEAAKLREIINREDAPKPKVGDILERPGGEFLMVTDDPELPVLSINGEGDGLWESGSLRASPPQFWDANRRGTFDEVFIERKKVNEYYVLRSKLNEDYILRSEVREVIERALNVEDKDGDTLADGFGLTASGTTRIVKILKELL